MRYWTWIIILFICSCNFIEKENELDNISIVLNSWNLNTKSNWIVDNGVLIIGINYKRNLENVKNSYFLDEESNELILKIIFFKFFDSFKKYNTIRFVLSFEGYEEIKTFSLKREDFESFREPFIKNPQFEDLVISIIRSVGYIDSARADSFIRFLDEESSVTYNDISLWDLVYNYSSTCKNNFKNLDYVFKFIVFVKAITVESISVINEDSKEFFRKMVIDCGYNSSIMELSLNEMKEEINKY